MDEQYTTIKSVDMIPDQIFSIDNVYISNGVCSNKGNAQGKVFFVSNQEKMYVAKLIVKPNDYRIQVGFLEQLKQNRYVPQIKYHNESAKVLKVDGKGFRIPVIVMQLAKRGDIFDFILDCMKYNKIKQLPIFHLSIPICKLMYEQLLIAVQSIHKKNIIHRDIKTQNLLFDQNFQIKIGDFGAAAKKNQNGQIYAHRFGTPQFSGPQVIRKNHSEEKSDLFSCTVVLYNIFTSLLLPFKYTLVKLGNDKFQYEQNYTMFSRRQPHKSLNSFWKKAQKQRNIKFPDEFKDLFSRVFVQNLQERPTINDILQDKEKFFKGKASIQEYKVKMEQMYNKIISIQHQSLKRNRIHEIVQKINKQHIISKQNILNSSVQGYRSSNLAQKSMLQSFTQKYAKFDIKKQQFQACILNKKDIFLISQPAFILAWIDFYVSNGIQNQDLSLFYFLMHRKINLYNVSYNEQYSTITVEFQINSKIDTQQDVQGEQIEINETIQLEGKFLITHPEKLIKINWSRQNNHDFLTQIALRDIQECIIALKQFEDNIK